MTCAVENTTYKLDGIQDGRQEKGLGYWDYLIPCTPKHEYRHRHLDFMSFRSKIMSQVTFLRLILVKINIDLDLSQ